MTAGTLSREALATIRGHGLTRAEYVGFHFADGKWHGDRCGCSDDRCIGHHHDESGDCGCLEPCIDQVLEQRGLADGSLVKVEHDCRGEWHLYWQAHRQSLGVQGREDDRLFRHTTALPVQRRVLLGCGCTRVELGRCDGDALHVFDQVCPVSHA